MIDQWPGIMSTIWKCITQKGLLIGIIWIGLILCLSKDQFEWAEQSSDAKKNQTNIFFKTWKCLWEVLGLYINKNQSLILNHLIYTEKFKHIIQKKLNFVLFCFFEIYQQQKWGWHEGLLCGNIQLLLQIAHVPVTW